MQFLCNSQILVHLLYFSSSFFLIRVVLPKDKSIALGVQTSLNSLIGWIPGPIIFGVLTDSACQIWEHPHGLPGQPSYKGYCMEYNNELYRIRYHNSHPLSVLRLL